MAYWSDYYKKPSWVYWLFDADGNLLYVGMSTRPLARIPTHIRRRPWGPLVAHHRLQWYPDRNTAKEAERSAIHHASPIHNLVRPQLECC